MTLILIFYVSSFKKIFQLYTLYYYYIAHVILHVEVTPLGSICNNSVSQLVLYDLPIMVCGYALLIIEYLHTRTNGNSQLKNLSIKINTIRISHVNFTEWNWYFTRLITIWNDGNCDNIYHRLLCFNFYNLYIFFFVFAIGVVLWVWVSYLIRNVKILYIFGYLYIQYAILVRIIAIINWNDAL